MSEAKKRAKEALSSLRREFLYGDKKTALTEETFRQSVDAIHALIAERERLESALSESCIDARAEGPYESGVGPCPEIGKVLDRITALEAENERLEQDKDTLFSVLNGVGLGLYSEKETYQQMFETVSAAQVRIEALEAERDQAYLAAARECVEICDPLKGKYNTMGKYYADQIRQHFGMEEL